MPRITFGKAAYLPGTSEDILDELERSELNITATSDGMVITTREAVENYIESYFVELPEYARARARKLKDFLKKSLDDIDEANTTKDPIGNIFFIS